MINHIAYHSPQFKYMNFHIFTCNNKVSCLPRTVTTKTNWFMSIKLILLYDGLFSPSRNTVYASTIKPESILKSLPRARKPPSPMGAVFKACTLETWKTKIVIALLWKDYLGGEKFHYTKAKYTTFINTLYLTR